MNKIYKVYLITNNLNKKQYVGITSSSLRRRFNQHLNSRSCCRSLREAVSSFGKSNFSIELITETNCSIELVRLEKHYIKEYNTLSPNGYNLTNGGTYCEMSEETKNRMSEKTSHRWKTSPESLQKGLDKCAEYIEQKKRKVVGVNIKNGKIVRYSTVSEASETHGNDISPCLGNKCNYVKGFCWFYDEGQTKEELKALTEKRLDAKIGGYNKMKNSWKKSNREERIKNIKESQMHRAKPLVSVCIESGNIFRYDTVNDAKRDGFSTLGIYNCLNNKDKTGQRRCWFYDNNQSDEFFTKETLKRIGSFKVDRILPFYATNGIIRIDFKSSKDLINTEFEWKRVNKAIKTGYKYKKLNWYFK